MSDSQDAAAPVETSKLCPVCGKDAGTWVGTGELLELYHVECWNKKVAQFLSNVKWNHDCKIGFSS